MLTYRNLRPDDVERICQHREAMFREAGRAAAVLEAMAQPFRLWLAPRLADGRYFGRFAEHGGKAIAGVGLTLIDWPPHPEHPADSRRGYILNLYVEPTYRRRGIGRKLMLDAQDEFVRLGVRYVVLHATAIGRPLYEGLGWAATTEMSRAGP